MPVRANITFTISRIVITSLILGFGTLNRPNNEFALRYDRDSPYYRTHMYTNLRAVFHYNGVRSLRLA